LIRLTHPERLMRTFLLVISLGLSIALHSEAASRHLCGFRHPGAVGCGDFESGGLQGWAITRAVTSRL